MIAMTRPRVELSAQANASKASVKPHRGGRSQKLNEIFAKFGM
jgi:hypothetical protein